MLYKVLILLILSKVECVLHSFGTDYIGNSVSVEDYKKFNLCLNKVCVRDAKRFLSFASYNNDTDPCMNFKEFSSGHFYEFRATNDRYRFIGLSNEFQRQKQHRLKRILREKIEDNEPKVFKLMKSYFQKCVDHGKLFPDFKLKKTNCYLFYQLRLC